VSNIAPLLDRNRAFAYASYLVDTKAPEGPYFEVAIIHHTDCGSTLLADDELRHGFAQRIGTDERTLADTPSDPGERGRRGSSARAAPRTADPATWFPAETYGSALSSRRSPLAQNDNSVPRNELTSMTRDPRRTAGRQLRSFNVAYAG